MNSRSESAAGGKQTISPRRFPILVVEPNPITRWVIRLTLEEAGYAVLDTADSTQALELAAGWPFRLILLNAELPESDAAVLAQQLRMRVTDAGVPILAYAEDPARLKKLRDSATGVTGTLLRPFLPSYLLQSIQFALRSKLPAAQRSVQTKRARLSQESYSERAQQAPQRSLAQGKRVLVVDDTPNDLEELTSALVLLGAQVVRTEDGVSALQEALQQRPDVIISDTLMPRMNGFELCLVVRLVPQLALVPTLLMPAGHIEELDRAIAQQLGVNAVVSRQPAFHKVIDALLIMLTAEPGKMARVPDPLPVDRRQLVLLFQAE